MTREEFARLLSDFTLSAESGDGARFAQHFADRAVYDFAERAWLTQFIDGWLARRPQLIAAQAAE